jgi:CTP:molybdopterin cytidylyltransferase MocA
MWSQGLTVTAAILLCAGGSTRFIGPQAKLITPFRGKPLVAWAIDNVIRARLEQVFVVVGPTDLTGLLPNDAVVVVNPDWASGQASSLYAGITAAEMKGHDAVVVGLGDQPFVPPESWMAVANADSEIAIATFNGQRSPPTRLSRTVWPLLPQGGDLGARSLMASRPDLVVEVPCAGRAFDIDTTDDLLWSPSPSDSESMPDP